MNENKTVTEKFRHFANTSASIREAISVFNPSFHCKTILRNLNDLEKLYYQEILLEQKDSFIKILESCKRDDFDLFGRIERDNELIDYLISVINSEDKKIKEWGL